MNGEKDLKLFAITPWNFEQKNILSYDIPRSCVLYYGFAAEKRFHFTLNYLSFYFPVEFNFLFSGTFLFAYFIFWATTSTPIFLLEVTVGQYLQRGSIEVWNMCPILKGKTNKNKKSR